MNICLLSSDFLPNVGGIAAHVFGLASGLSRLGHHVDVVVPGSARPFSKPLYKVEELSGFRVIRLSVPGLPRVTHHFFSWACAGLIRALRHKAGGYDVVHWHTPISDGKIAARLTESRRIFTNHTSHFLEWELEGKNHSLARQVLAPAEAVICPSRELAQATLSAGFDRSQIWTIPNGVDINVFSPLNDGSRIRAKYGIGSEELVVLCPRRWEKKNGVTYWLRALPIVLEAVGPRLPVRFLLVGDYLKDDESSDRANILNTIADINLGNRLIITGNIPHYEMPEVFASANLVVLPSLMEATSVAGLEAMASGVPLIGTQVGGIPEIIVHGQTGLLVPPMSPEALAEAMVLLLRDPDRRRAMGQAAHQRVLDEFTWDIIAEKTIHVYRTVLSQPKRWRESSCS
jgi:glycosyltransferase involved in cell wall biosynthesis